jgi:hypothetical protein
VNDSLRGRQSGKAGSDPDQFEVVESMRRLASLGLTAAEVEELGLDQATLQAICEYARLDDGEQRAGSAEAVDATLRMLEQEMQSCELEQEMLGMRRRAISKRVRLLGKVAQMLRRDSGEC